MPTLETTATFFVLSLMLGYSPGPDNLYVLLQSATRGRKAGWAVILGLCTGLVAHTAAIAFGLAAALAASASALTIVKYLGASYLVYLAWQVLRAPLGQADAASSQPFSFAGLYARGIVMNLSNPKVLLFFLAFLPQFVQQGGAPVAFQTGWLGMIFILATFVSFGSIAYFSGSISSRMLNSATAQRTLHRVAGVVFLGLAIRVAVSEL